MRALVIGGTGFIGRRLVEYLIKYDCEVTVATSGKTPNPFKDEVASITFDRFSEESIESKLSSPPFFDVVFDNLAFRRDDVVKTSNFFEGRIGRYVFISSAAVYEGLSGTLTEDQFDPMKFEIIENRKEASYSEGKRNVEAYLFQKAGFEVLAARFPNVLGHDDSTKRFQGHVSKILDQHRIAIPPNEGRRNYAWVDDCGRFLAWIGLNGKKGVYNGASPEAITVRELSKKIANFAGVDVQLEEPDKNEEISDYYNPVDYILSTEKAKGVNFSFTEMEDWLKEEVRAYMQTGGKSKNSAEYRNYLF